jgi:hypothetical protein
MFVGGRYISGLFDPLAIFTGSLLGFLIFLLICWVFNG